METTSTIPAPAPKNLAARFFGVVFSPRATYAAVAAQPRVFGMLALVALLVGGGTAVFMATDVGKQAWLDAAVR